MAFRLIGDCREMGKCRTFLIEILESNESLEGLDRNERTTLSNMNINGFRSGWLAKFNRNKKIKII